jgi:hypothetical protein
VGSAKLIVDGTDATLFRKVEISLSPSRVQARALPQLLQLSRDTYNGALQHRRDAWQMTRNSSQPASISRFDQFISEGAQFVKRRRRLIRPFLMPQTTNLTDRRARRSTPRGDP